MALPALTGQCAKKETPSPRGAKRRGDPGQLGLLCCARSDGEIFIQEGLARLPLFGTIACVQIA
jgi:hypothetical protein